MKKQLVATLVGGVILFLCQFLSWTILNIHADQFGYTANQDKILETLAQNLEEGSYMMPGLPANSSAEAHQALMESSAGKPWATVTYHKAMNNNMGMNMVRGLSIDLVSVFLLVWLLSKFASIDFQTVVLTSLAVGATGYLTIPYLNSIWFDSNSIGYLIDTLVQWGLTGV